MVLFAALLFDICWLLELIFLIIWVLLFHFSMVSSTNGKTDLKFWSKVAKIESDVLSLLSSSSCFGNSLTFIEVSLKVKRSF